MGQKNESEEHFHSIQKQLLIDLTQELATDFGHKNLCKSVAKIEKIGNKINKICVQSFVKNFDRIIAEIETENKANELIDENNSTDNTIVCQTIDTIIEKQKKIKEMNETIVEKTLDLKQIKAEEIRSQLISNVLTNSENEFSFDTIKSQLNRSDNN